MLRVCEHCFATLIKDANRHVALCKMKKTAESLTLLQVTDVLRHLLEKVEAQERTIQQLKGVKHEFPPAREFPELEDADLHLLLKEGVDAFVAKHDWPLHVWQKKPYVPDGEEWREATTDDVAAVVAGIQRFVQQAFDQHVARMGWLDDDPHGRYPEACLVVYALTAPTIKASLMKLCV
jgi:hypothetical protein